MSTRREPCPKCDRGPRDRALAITTDECGKVFFCHRCGYRGADHDHDHACDRRDDDELHHDREGRLESIWAQTVPLRSTVGETYLKHRQCVMPPADSDLRFLPGNNWFPPSLCALVTDAITAEPMSLQFTRLRADGLDKAGTERDKVLLKGHPKAGGVIRLWPDSDVRYGLGVGEGVETCLAAAHAFTPVWSTIDARNLTRFPVLDVIQTILVFADNDAPGLAAARACGSRWGTAGREARLVVPDRGDVNDAVAA